MLDSLANTTNEFSKDISVDNDGTTSICNLEQKGNKIADIESDAFPQEPLGREHFHESFDTNAYLRDFYTNVDDPAMQMVLFYLPNIVARIEKTESLLDFGAGPTIHVAVCFREKVNEIYLADFLPQNRQELSKWVERRSKFNWTKTLQMIATYEGLNLLATNNLNEEMEETTRQKVREILFCNCHSNPPLDAKRTGRQTFDIITTFYTIEYCCETRTEYRDAIRRVANLLNRGGHFIMGAILEEEWCSFGGRKFKCLYVTREFVIECLELAGLTTASGPSGLDSKAIPSFEVNGMVLFCCRKK